MAFAAVLHIKQLVHALAAAVRPSRLAHDAHMPADAAMARGCAAARLSAFAAVLRVVEEIHACIVAQGVAAGARPVSGDVG